MKYNPHDYQRYVINRLIQEPKVALFLDMGLGKTGIVLTAINDLRFNRFLINKTLIIAPKKVAEDTWTREQKKWDHLKLLRINLVLGTAKQRIKKLNTTGDIWIISRENVQWLVDYYRNDWPFDTVVLDESSSFKNHQAKRFKSLKTVLSHITRLIELSGTPAPNGLMDLWSQIYLLDEGQRLGKNITTYRNNYFRPDARNATTIFSYAPCQGADEQIHSLIRDVCISLSSKDYLQLPDMVDDIRYVKLSPTNEALYRKLEREKVLELQDKEVDAGSAAVLSNKLLQLCNGAIYVTKYVEEEQVRETVRVHTEKLEAFMEMIEELGGQNVLVFYNFQHDVERIREALKKTKLVVGELGTSEDIANWNSGKINVLLAHPASAAYGLNLQDGGHHIIWFGLNWNLELYQQATARLHRQGQKYPVINHLLCVEGTVDELVLAALEDKAATQNTLLDALKVRVQGIREEEQK